MIAIVNTDPNWGIGKANELQVSISADLIRFKEMTTGKVIIYGSKTILTYPNHKPLPSRINIVLSRNPDLIIDGAIICNSIDSLLTKIEQLKEDHNFVSEDFIVVGGETIYRRLLPYCTECHVTRVNRVLPADSYFPNLDLSDDWQLVFQSEWHFDQKNDLDFCYIHYRRE